MPNCRYLIIGHTRSGTTAIHLALMGHPEVSAFDGELRPSPFFDKGLRAFSSGHLAPEEAERGYPILFDAICGIRNPTAPAFGAKTALNANAGSIISTLREHFPAMKIIHVVRNDTVAHFGSSYVANRTGVFHSWQQTGTAKRQQVALPHWPLLHFERGNRRLNESLRTLAESHDYLCIENESYVADPETTHKQLFEFIGVTPSSVHWQVSRKVMPNPREFILNYDQCLAWLERKEQWFPRLMTRAYGGWRSGRLFPFPVLARNKRTRIPAK